MDCNDSHDNLTIKEESTEDKEIAEQINRLAFGQEDEANFVRNLRKSDSIILSMIARVDDEPIGHILFTPMTFEPDEKDGEEGRELSKKVVIEGKLASLSPLAVIPSHQRRGFGAALVKRGLDEMKRMGYAGVIVLGHPSYYPRLGFKPAHEYGLRCQAEVPLEAFMAIELWPGALEDMQGTAFFCPTIAAYL